MKVTLLSYEDGGGGAGRAALKLHRALLSEGVDSRLRVDAKRSDLDSVDNRKSLRHRFVSIAGRALNAHFMKLQRASDPGLRSPALFDTGLARELNDSDADVVQLNWVCGLLSIEEIARVVKPVVWRLSDMWAFAGTEHYTDDGQDARWRSGYTRSNRRAADGLLDIDRWAWNRKLRTWKRPMHIITPSDWLARCVRESALMRDWPVTVIPTTLDVRQFQPWPKALAREILGLPQDLRLVMFGALGGGRDPRKGRSLLQSALRRLAGRLSGAGAVIFGESEPPVAPDFGIPAYWLGHLSDDATLSLAYSAADVLVLPSLQDNLPQTGVEAQSCGCPVVAFDCTGMPDLLEHRRTGYLARAFDIEDLAHGIEWVVADRERNAELSREARARAMRLWAPSVVVPQYVDVYRRALQRA
jgi:glycosyltransferase involved in cell wall biosynthesis